MKHKAAPLEFSFTADTFTLEIQTTQDGARLTLEQEERESARAAAAQNQLPLCPEHATPPNRD